MMIRGELVEPFHSNYSYTIYKHQLDFWSPTNTDATYPRLAGIGSVSKWKSSINYVDIDDFVEQIPYSETQNYLKKVLE